ncbi:MAG: sulfatase [Halanaerobiaceae bacterium]
MDKNKPNILLIMCDQLRADVLGCYGNDYVKTPNIDRLAENGITFNRAYSTSPVCIPARHATISGKSPFQLGMLENTGNRAEILYPLARQIRDAGYYTCAVGKMHFVPTREHFGFDRMYLSEEVPRHIQDDDYLHFLLKNGFENIVEPHGKRSETYYVPQVSELPEEYHTTAWTGKKTGEVIKNNRNRPFFIFSSFIKPHPPFDPCEPYDKMYPSEEVPMPVRNEQELNPKDRIIDKQNDYKVNGIENVTDKDVRKIRSHYYGSVTQMDKQVGNILDTLEEYGLRDNTIIIFTSDHGEMLGDHYGFGKRTFYEQSARIPFIVSWPEKLPENETRNQFAVLPDIYSTLISAAEGKIPQNENIAGKNLIPVCKDNKEKVRDKIYAEFGFDKNLKFMLRWNNYKYIYFANGGLESLFDLAEDPEELNDIAEENPDLCKECRKELVKYYKNRGFDKAVERDKLVEFEYEPIQPSGYIDQYPHWPETVVDDWHESLLEE